MKAIEFHDALIQDVEVCAPMIVKVVFREISILISRDVEFEEGTWWGRAAFCVTAASRIDLKLDIPCRSRVSIGEFRHRSKGILSVFPFESFDPVPVDEISLQLANDQSLRVSTTGSLMLLDLEIRTREGPLPPSFVVNRSPALP